MAAIAALIRILILAPVAPGYTEALKLFTPSLDFLPEE
jgi:hypothetical protein